MRSFISSRDAIEETRRANAELIEIVFANIFTSDILGRDEFVSDVVTWAMIERGYEPTSWSIIGPLMQQAVRRGIIEKTGNIVSRVRYRDLTLRRKENSGHYGPTYRLSLSRRFRPPPGPR